MPEYIERDMILKIISHKPSSPTTDREDRLINYYISAVKNFPAADVRPVVRARWITPPKNRDYAHMIDYYECPLCGFIEDYLVNFCPYCGADMRESDE